MRRTASRRNFCLLRATAAILFLAGAACTAAAQNDGTLKYSLAVSPQPLRIQEGGQGTGRMTFTFTVSNTSAAAFAGKTPSCQLFEVEVFKEGADGEKSVWKLSDTQKFCEKETPVAIPAGQKWKKRAIWNWNLKSSAIWGGEYKAVATFIATGGKTTADVKVETYVLVD